MSTRPPERPCTSCGQMCRSKNRICMPCRTGTVSTYADGTPLALTGGRWVPRGPILVWRSDEETAA